MKRRGPIHAYKRLLANGHDRDYTVHNTWLHQYFSENMKFRKLENGLYQLDDTDRKPIADYHSLHLYHLIREHKLLTWWN